MQIRLLGSVDVLVGGMSRPVPGIRKKALLAVLALHHGEVVSTDRLVDIVWSDTLAVVSPNAVQCHISRLRQIVGGRGSIRTSAPGYVFGGDTDVSVAGRLIDEGRRTADPREGAELLRSALALWRGRSLDDLSGLPWLDQQGEQLDGLRWQAEQALVERRLALGEHTVLVPDLERMAREHPLDESVHAHLMLALYRSGRQAEALRVYQRLRGVLRDELGLDPGRTLRELESAILRQEPELTLVPARVTTTGAPESPPAPAEDDTPLAAATRALVDEGNLGAARQLFETAYSLAERTGDGNGVAAAALGLGGLWVHEQQTVAASTLLAIRLRRALDGVDAGSALALRLRTRLTCEANYRTVRNAQTLVALDEACGSGDPVARAEALNLAHQCLLGPDNGVVRSSLAVDLIAESATTGRRVDLLLGLLWQTVDLFLAGDPHAERWLAELNDLLTVRPHLAIAHVAAGMQVMLAVRAGRFDKAEQLATAAAELGAAAGDVDAGWRQDAQLVMIRWFQGRIGELRPMLDAVVSSVPGHAVDNSLVAAFAFAAASGGARRTAELALARLRGAGLAHLPKTSTWLVTMLGVVEAADLLGDAEIAAEAYDLLLPFAQLPMITNMAVACFGPVQHALGVAALTTGNTDAAVDHLALAIHNGLTLTHWPAVALARHRHADALARRGRPGDDDMAAQERAAAIGEASSMGMTIPNRA